ncbi:unnamed protein product [Phytophthora fragariaefolia]|uniref:Unnamed protein product n=1 Tax=Phytophthora fragariaefolia TaxID=1490495 RepID=A0A9W6TU00_9STRA|nr:unnamed protein product [Phytophthora fragariaefolia]
MAPSSDTSETGGSSPSVSPHAGTTQASVPSTPSAAPTGGASGGSSESSSASDSVVLSPTLGAVPRSGADAPEAASGVSSADSQPQRRGHRHRWHRPNGPAGSGPFTKPFIGSGPLGPLRTDYKLDRRLEAAESLSDVVDTLAPISRSPAPWEDEISELRDDVASLEARLAASEASLLREVDLRLKAERLCNQASQERNADLDNLQRLRLDHADAARQLVATNIALEQSSQVAAALEQRRRRLDKSLATTHKAIRQGREYFKACIASYGAPLRQLHEYLEQSDRPSSDSGGADAGSTSTMPAAFTTFLEELSQVTSVPKA